MWKRILNFLWRMTLTIGLLGLAGILFPRLITSVYSLNKIHSVENAPTERLAIVFGAGLRRDGSPTAILRDRVETAAQLYFAGKVQKILMSGDNSYDYYNEPESMRQYALELGIPSDDIVLDYAGRRTYDTCYRAKTIFQAESALLVTQQFHLPRALFLCNALGLSSEGVEANNNRYRRVSLLFWNIREQLATVAAFLDVYIYTPVPVLGQPEPLFMD